MTFVEYLNEAYYNDKEIVKYHKDVFFPKNWEKLVNGMLHHIYNLKYSHHASEEATDRKVPTVNKRDLNAKEVFEIVTDLTGKLLKVGFRIQNLDKKDVIAVISKEGLVITTWLNSRNDSHTTLRRSEYAQGLT